MSRTPRVSRRLVRVVAALVVGITAGGTQVASASAHDSARHRERSCTVVDGITEQTIRWESLGQGGMAMVVGDYASYYDNLYDANENVVGNVIGQVSAVAASPTPGHVKTLYNEGIIVPQGSVRTSGVVDRYKILSGQVQRIPAYGLSGSVAGKVGYREAQVIIPSGPVTSPADVRVRLKLVLC